MEQTSPAGAGAPAPTGPGASSKVKKIALIVAIFIFLIGGCVGGIFYLTSGPVKAADAFFAQLRDGKIKEAYASTAGVFQDVTTFEDFAAYVEKFKLNEYAERSWTSRSVENSTGEISGTITTASGKVLPVIIEFVKEQDTWKISYLTFRERVSRENSGMQAELAALAPDSPLGQAAHESMRLFMRAANAGDFTAFHKQISTSWQKEVTPEAFKKSFADFVTNPLPADFLDNLEPVFTDDPVVYRDETEELVEVKGYYETTKGDLYFVLEYFQESGQWKLEAIEVGLE